VTLSTLGSLLQAAGDALGRDEAREAARRELSRKAYQDAQPPWTYRAVRWVLDKLSEALGNAAANVPGGKVGLAILVALLIGLVAVVLVRLRPTATPRGSADLFTTGEVLSAAGHRVRAEAAAGEGRWRDAVRERLRAVARDLETRGVVDPRPGRTADELAREAGAAVAVLAAPLQRGTRVFDDVWYGDHPADAASYAVLVEVDSVVTATRLVAS
jgi:hypothetical protein